MKPVMIALVASLTVVAPSAALAQTPAKVVVLASDIPVARTPPDLDWDEMALDDAEALDWAAA